MALRNARAQLLEREVANMRHRPPDGIFAAILSRVPHRSRDMVVIANASYASAEQDPTSTTHNVGGAYEPLVRWFLPTSTAERVVLTTGVTARVIVSDAPGGRGIWVYNFSGALLHCIPSRGRHPPPPAVCVGGSVAVMAADDNLVIVGPRAAMITASGGPPCDATDPSTDIVVVQVALPSGVAAIRAARAEAERDADAHDAARPRPPPSKRLPVTEDDCVDELDKDVVWDMPPTSEPPSRAQSVASSAPPAPAAALRLANRTTARRRSPAPGGASAPGALSAATAAAMCVLPDEIPDAILRPPRDAAGRAHVPPTERLRGAAFFAALPRYARATEAALAHRGRVLQVPMLPAVRRQPRTARRAHSAGVAAACPEKRPAHHQRDAVGAGVAAGADGGPVVAWAGRGWACGEPPATRLAYGTVTAVAARPLDGAAVTARLCAHATKPVVASWNPLTTPISPAAQRVFGVEAAAHLVAPCEGEWSVGCGSDTTVAVSHDGRRFAAVPGGSRFVVVVGDVSAPHAADMILLPCPVTCVTFDYGGTAMIAAGFDGVVIAPPSAPPQTVFMCGP